MPSLMWLFVVPFLASLLLLLCSKFSAKNLKRLALGLSFIPLLMLLYGNASWIGSSIKYAWLPALGIEFYLSVDTISLLFLYLTALIIPISLCVVHSENLPHPNLFFGLVLFLEGLLIGFFTSRDIALFTLFWEAMLLPLYFIINIWGGPRRQTAALKFLIYMIAGSSLMVAAVLALYFSSSSIGASSFDMDVLKGVVTHLPYATWVGAIFLLAFAVKTPLFPFHAWLPDAYYQAPTTGTILLSALLSKAGIYGFLRIGLGLFPMLLQEWNSWLVGLAIAGVLYGGLVAWMQSDFKRLIAYSSLSHVNFILVGIFVLNQTAHAGAILQALNHGITITALFLVSGWLADRLGSTAIGPIGGLAQFLPHLCWLTLFFVLASVALPGTNNFVGELLIFFGFFQVHPWLTVLLGTTVILSVMYMLRWMQKMYFGEPGHFQDTWVDIRGKEMLIALPLVLLILWIGIYPAPLLKQIEPATARLTVAPSLESSQ